MNQLNSSKNKYSNRISDIDVSESCKLILLDLLSINNSSDLNDRAPQTEEWYMKGQTRDLEAKPKFLPTNLWMYGIWLKIINSSKN